MIVVEVVVVGDVVVVVDGAAVVLVVVVLTAVVLVVDVLVEAPVPAAVVVVAATGSSSMVVVVACVVTTAGSTVVEVDRATVVVVGPASMVLTVGAVVAGATVVGITAGTDVDVVAIVVVAVDVAVGFDGVDPPDPLPCWPVSGTSEGPAMRSVSTEPSSAGSAAIATVAASSMPLSSTTAERFGPKMTSPKVIWPLSNVRTNEPGSSTKPGTAGSACPVGNTTSAFAASVT